MGEVAVLLGVLGIIAAGGGLGVTSLAIHTAMVEKVNSKVAAIQRFEGDWWGPARLVRLFSEYRRLCPGEPLVRRQVTIIGVACLLWALAIAWLFLS